MLWIHAPSQKPTHTFSLSQKGSQKWVHIHTISICPIYTLLCVSRLRGNRRQLRAVGLPLVSQPAPPRRMGWRRALHVGERHSGTPRAWILSSLKQVSLCVIQEGLLQPCSSEAPIICQARILLEFLNAGAFRSLTQMFCSGLNQQCRNEYSIIVFLHNSPLDVVVARKKQTNLFPLPSVQTGLSVGKDFH